MRPRQLLTAQAAISSNRPCKASEQGETRCHQLCKRAQAPSESLYDATVDHCSVTAASPCQAKGHRILEVFSPYMSSIHMATLSGLSPCP